MTVWLIAGLGRETDENRRSGDAKTGKDGYLHHVEYRTEDNSRSKLTSNYGDRQRGHGDSKGRERGNDKNVGH